MRVLTSSRFKFFWCRRTITDWTLLFTTFNWVYCYFFKFFWYQPPLVYLQRKYNKENKHFPQGHESFSSLFISSDNQFPQSLLSKCLQRDGVSEKCHQQNDGLNRSIMKEHREKIALRFTLWKLKTFKRPELEPLSSFKHLCFLR